MRHFLTSLLLFACAANGQSTTTFTIAGHSLGETFEEMMNKESSARTEECRGLLSKKHKPKRNEDLSIKACQSLTDAAEGRRGRFGRGWLVGKPDPFALIFRFNGGHLVAMDSTFNMVGDTGLSYDAIEQDAIAKYGPPTKEGTTTWQNGFGATWHPRWSQWEKDDLYIRIQESPRTTAEVNPIVSVSAASIKELQKEAAESDSEHKNIFDPIP
jgi:hypothetical protein